MVRLIILGSSNAIPDERHENTHMVLVGEQRTVLIDCVGTPTVRLKQAGVDPSQITDLILTHFHPDHVSGVPLLLMNMWLLGRKRPLHIYGLHYTMDCLEDLMGFYGWQEWPNFFPVAFIRLPEEEGVLVLEGPEFRILASPVRHFVPTIGLRIETGEQTLAYSCDTEPCAAVVGLAREADWLLHEATGPGFGHSSPAQAATVASEAGAKRLVLIHYPTGAFARPGWAEQAEPHFAGPVSLAEDFQEIVLAGGTQAGQATSLR